jgi:hypothetical protein
MNDNDFQRIPHVGRDPEAAAFGCGGLTSGAVHAINASAHSNPGLALHLYGVVTSPPIKREPDDPLS